MRRLDRHVPLHVGGLDPKTGAFLEFYGTHDSADHKAGVFDGEQFNKLFSLMVLEKSNQKSDKAKAQAASARSERDAEHQARRDAFTGGRASTSGRSLRPSGGAVEAAGPRNRSQNR